MSGRSEAEMIGRPLDVLFPEDSRSNSMKRIEEASKGAHWKTEEIPILRRNGEIRIALWNSANIYDEDGKTLIATVAQGQDITEHKQADEALQESEEKHRALFETAHDAIFLTDETGKFVDVNPAACASLGYSKKELLRLSNREIDADP
ncbi:MAG: PAS domain S-box protein, partial [Candidatus Latescibacteria bacterium]|nr:PAS domain S-box protein [Candidatus Latescibacterota bacterium]